MIFQVKKHILPVIFILISSGFMISCASSGGGNGSGFVEETNTPKANSEMSEQEKELAGYLAQTSPRRFMKIPKSNPVATTTDANDEKEYLRWKRYRDYERNEAYEEHLYRSRMYQNTQVNYGESNFTPTYASPGIR